MFRQRGGGLKYWKRDTAKVDPESAGAGGRVCETGRQRLGFWGEHGVADVCGGGASREGRGDMCCSVDADINNATLLLRSAGSHGSGAKCPGGCAAGGHRLAGERSVAVCHRGAGVGIQQRWWPLEREDGGGEGDADSAAGHRG